MSPGWHVATQTMVPLTEDSCAATRKEERTYDPRGSHKHAKWGKPDSEGSNSIPFIEHSGKAKIIEQKHGSVVVRGGGVGKRIDYSWALRYFWGGYTILYLECGGSSTLFIKTHRTVYKKG